MTPQAPQTLAQKRSDIDARTVQNTPSARGVLFPPLRSSGTGTPEPRTRPSWLAEKVNESRRAAHPQPCPKCGADTLVGPDHDTVAYTARVDPTDTGAIDEVIALLAGRHSFDYVRGDLHHRAPHHIHTTSRPYPVLLTHACTPEVLF